MAALNFVEFKSGRLREERPSKLFLEIWDLCPLKCHNSMDKGVCLHTSWRFLGIINLGLGLIANLFGPRLCSF